MQYTIRGITDDLDRAAREMAEREGMSLNQVLVRALRSAFGVEEKATKKRELPASFDGTPLEPEVIEVLDSQRQVDASDWE